MVLFRDDNWGTIKWQKILLFFLILCCFNFTILDPITVSYVLNHFFDASTNFVTITPTGQLTFSKGEDGGAPKVRIFIKFE